MVAKLNQLRRFGFNLRFLQPFIPQDMIDAENNFLATAKSAIQRRLQREEKGDTQTETGRPDIIGLMLREMKGGDRLSDNEITANSILIVAGGAETTSTCLTALIYYLCNTPRVMKKLQIEIRRAFTTPDEITINATRDLPYLSAAIDEALRIFPVASYITPRLTPKTGHTIDGELIPGNVSRLVSSATQDIG